MVLLLYCFVLFIFFFFFLLFSSSVCRCVGWLPIKEGERECVGVWFVPVWTYRLVAGVLSGLVDNLVCVTTSSYFLAQRRLITQRDNSSTTWCPSLRPFSLFLYLSVTWVAYGLSCRCTERVKETGCFVVLLLYFLALCRNLTKTEHNSLMLVWVAAYCNMFL